LHKIEGSWSITTQVSSKSFEKPSPDESTQSHVKNAIESNIGNEELSSSTSESDKKIASDISEEGKRTEPLQDDKIKAEKSKNTIKQKNIFLPRLTIHEKIFYLLVIISAVLGPIYLPLYLLFVTIVTPSVIAHFKKNENLPSKKVEKCLIKHFAISFILAIVIVFAFPPLAIAGISISITCIVSILAYLSFCKTLDEFESKNKSIDIERGVPIEVIDALGNLFSIQSKILLFNLHIDSHKISSKNEKLINEFIERHNLYDVKVRLNQFSPQGEIKRIFQKNNHMSIFFRVLFGPLGLIGYIFNIGRLFGGDHYNPITNTVNIYSNHPAIIIHELGHALDTRKRIFPGVYMLLRHIPLVSLYQEYAASKYAIDFFRENEYYHEELEAYKVLFPAYSTYVFGATFEYIPSPFIVWLFTPFIIIGHIIGRVKLAHRKSDIEADGGVIKQTIEEGRIKDALNWKILLAVLPGFAIGIYFFQIWGALIGGAACYFLYQEFLKFRRNAQHLKENNAG